MCTHIHGHVAVMRKSEGNFWASQSLLRQAVSCFCWVMYSRLPGCKIWGNSLVPHFLSHHRYVRLQMHAITSGFSIGVQGSNSDLQVCTESLFLAEPSHWPWPELCIQCNECIKLLKCALFFVVYCGQNIFLSRLEASCFECLLLISNSWLVFFLILEFLN